MGKGRQPTGALPEPSEEWSVVSLRSPYMCSTDNLAHRHDSDLLFPLDSGGRFGAFVRSGRDTPRPPQGPIPNAGHVPDRKERHEKCNKHKQRRMHPPFSAQTRLRRSSVPHGPRRSSPHLRDVTMGRLARQAGNPRFHSNTPWPLISPAARLKIHPTSPQAQFGTPAAFPDCTSTAPHTGAVRTPCRSQVFPSPGDDTSQWSSDSD